MSDTSLSAKVHAAREALDNSVREVVAWHFNHETESDPFGPGGAGRPSRDVAECRQAERARVAFELTEKFDDKYRRFKDREVALWGETIGRNAQTLTRPDLLLWEGQHSLIAGRTSDAPPWLARKTLHREGQHRTNVSRLAASPSVPNRNSLPQGVQHCTSARTSNFLSPDTPRTSLPAEVRHHPGARRAWIRSSGEAGETRRHKPAEPCGIGDRQAPNERKEVNATVWNSDKAGESSLSIRFERRAS
jgi:hypothetical protein